MLADWPQPGTDWHPGGSPLTVTVIGTRIARDTETPPCKVDIAYGAGLDTLDLATFLELYTAEL